MKTSTGPNLPTGIPPQRTTVEEFYSIQFIYNEISIKCKIKDETDRKFCSHVFVSDETIYKISISIANHCDIHIGDILYM